MPLPKGWRHSEETKLKIARAKLGSKNAMFGRKHSKETLLKMSEKHKLYRASDETRAKLSASKTGSKHPMFGKTHSDEAKKKISQASKGRPSPMRGKSQTEETKAKIVATLIGNKRALGSKHTPEARRKISEALSGSKSRWWRGGITEKHKRIRNTLDYRLWREAVFNRDDFTCRACAKRGGELEADHIMPFSTHPDLRFEVYNGRTLCEPCHRKTDTYGRKALAHSA